MMNKNPYQLLRAMRVLIISRMGRSEEAYEMAMDMVAENPVDRTVVDMLVLVFNSINRREKATELYE